MSKSTAFELIDGLEGLIRSPTILGMLEQLRREVEEIPISSCDTCKHGEAHYCSKHDERVAVMDTEVCGDWEDENNE